MKYGQHLTGGVLVGGHKELEGVAAVAGELN